MASATKYKLAILDEEAKERNKFLNFFEDDFDVTEIDFVKDIGELLEKIRNEHIDGIAIDYNLKDHRSKFTENGDFFFKALQNALKNFPAFVLTQDGARAKRETKLINPLYIIDKEKINLQNAKDKKAFIDEIRLIIKNYKTELSEAIARVKELEKIRKKKQLSNEEEDEYLTLHQFLNNTLGAPSPIPIKFFAPETNKKLDEIIAKTDELISKIKKQK